ncbi:GTP 3',8-cyclase MoaA [Candidatus Desulforudis audaxviator]|uniref:GTP 3',8-cyclase n=1 Tax=Desulforudis audaxviator (strain MP104C) TaxID=477974 RepID=B1I2J4_DESAP|nr:GTP 3',8-cyclase MoaA [Candidatus Desulforudis audaxviator]ACA59155.1 molybdenum cofactor biosynthesis protein A [Candidatus Desulforudis audaxviator MP104C]
MRIVRDNFERRITYLRVSLTERCNLNCFYCRPGEQKTPTVDGLPLESLMRVIRAGARVGIRKIRLTGGEPLVRPDVIPVVAALNEIPQIDDIALTTNGSLLAPRAQGLRAAGLKRVNISLDTLRPDRFRSITRNGELSAVMNGLEAALAQDLHPVKLNMVVMRGINDDEIDDFVRLTEDRPLHIRFIELMPIGVSSHWASEYYVPADEIRRNIDQRYGPLQTVRPAGGDGPARCWKIPGFIGSIGFIAPLSGYFCPSCNRLRLTAAGTLRPCLYKEDEIDLVEPLARGVNDDELAGLVVQAILRKPQGHPENGILPVCDRLMSQIGG